MGRKVAREDDDRGALVRARSQFLDALDQEAPEVLASLGKLPRWRWSREKEREFATTHGAKGLLAKKRQDGGARRAQSEVLREKFFGSYPVLYSTPWFADLVNTQLQTNDRRHWMRPAGPFVPGLVVRKQPPAPAMRPPDVWNPASESKASYLGSQLRRIHDYVTAVEAWETREGLRPSSPRKGRHTSTASMDDGRQFRWLVRNLFKNESYDKIAISETGFDGIRRQSVADAAKRAAERAGIQFPRSQAKSQRP